MDDEWDLPDGENTGGEEPPVKKKRGGARRKKREPLLPVTAAGDLLPGEGGLTPDEAALVEEFLLDRDYGKAYLRARPDCKHTNPQSASVLGYRILGRSHVRAWLDLREQQLAEKTGYTPEWVLREYGKLYLRACKEYEVLDRMGNPTGTYTFQGAVARQVLRDIGEHIGMFKRKVEIGGEVNHTHVHAPVPLSQLNLPLETLEKLYEAIMEKTGGGQKEPVPVRVLPALPPPKEEAIGAEVEGAE